MKVLYIHPIKQGLKPQIKNPDLKSLGFVLYIHPIKQGLKLRDSSWIKRRRGCSLHTSNKTRIETLAPILRTKSNELFFTYIQ